MRTAIILDRTGKEIYREELTKRAARMSMQAVMDQRRLDALAKEHPEAFAARIESDTVALHFFYDPQGRSQHMFGDPFAKPEPKPRGKFTETKPGTYRTTLAPAKLLELFPYVPNRPEWKLLPWAAVKAESPKHDTFIGYCLYGDSRHFYFQERGNPEALVIVQPATHDCLENAQPVATDGPLGHGWACAVCGAPLQAG